MKRHLKYIKVKSLPEYNFIFILFIILFRCCYDFPKKDAPTLTKGKNYFFPYTSKLQTKHVIEPGDTKGYAGIPYHDCPQCPFFFNLLKFTEILFELLDMLRDSQFNLLIFIINHLNFIKYCSLLLMSCSVYFFVKTYHTPLTWRDVLVHPHV